jgi:hypothetical protein
MVRTPNRFSIERNDKRQKRFYQTAKYEWR